MIKAAMSSSEELLSTSLRLPLLLSERELLSSLPEEEPDKLLFEE